MVHRTAAAAADILLMMGCVSVHLNSRVTGSNSVEALIFFSGFFFPIA